MTGIIFSIIAGVSMSLQGVFNTRMSEKIGLWPTNLFVQFTGFILTLILVFIADKDGIKKFRIIKNINKLYLLGGLLGVLIIFTVMEGIENLGPTYSISIILIAQLTAAGIIDAFGLFGSKQLTFDITKILGIIVMVIGIILFKWQPK